MIRMKAWLVAVSFLLLTCDAVEAQYLRADHTKANLALIPDAALPAAIAKRVVVRRASVGGNIDGGLNAIQGSNVKYDRAHWTFSDRGNPSWEAKIADLMTYTAAHLSSYDIFSMKFCYIDPDASFPVYRDSLLALEQRYPTKTFIWWTIPIKRDVDGSEGLRQAFNESVRDFAAANGKPLFDIADIEAYDSLGALNTDGSGNELQQAMWSADGGHLNSDGAWQVASAWWWLMARVAGWNGVTDVASNDEQPATFALAQNWPNPCNPSTTIAYQVGAGSRKNAEGSRQKAVQVKLAVYDLLGREVAVLVSGYQTPGQHTVVFDGSRLASGVYLYRLMAEGQTLARKMVLSK